MEEDLSLVKRSSKSAMREFTTYIDVGTELAVVGINY